MAKFEYGKGKDGQWYWHLKAKNAEIVACGEGYKSRRSALRGIDAVRAAASGAIVIEKGA